MTSHLAKGQRGGVAQVVFHIAHSVVALAVLHLREQRAWRLLQQVAQQREAAAVRHANLDPPHAPSRAPPNQRIHPRHQRLAPLHAKPLRSARRLCSTVLDWMVCWNHHRRSGASTTFPNTRLS